MGKQVCYGKCRFVFPFTDGNINLCPVLLNDDTVECKRHCNPLVLLNSTVIVGIEVRHLCILIQRVLFDVDSRRVDMRAENIHSVYKRLRACLEKYNGFFRIVHIYLVPCLYRFPSLNQVLHITIARFFRQLLRDAYTFPLRLSQVKACQIPADHPLQFLQVRFIICVPQILSVHVRYSPFVSLQLLRCHPLYRTGAEKGLSYYLFDLWNRPNYIRSLC